MRLFIAIDLDDAARASIGRVQKRMAAAIDRDRHALTWVAVDRMHLTLVFLGEVADPLAQRIVQSMTEPVQRRVFDVVFEGVGVFPPDRGDRGRKPPRVLWMGVSDGEAETVAVQREIAERVTAAGAALEPRDFHPHLTLARWRRSAWADRRRVSDLGSSGQVARIHVDHLTLYQSRLSSSGPSYTPLARATLLLPLMPAPDR